MLACRTADDSRGGEKPTVLRNRPTRVGSVVENTPYFFVGTGISNLKFLKYLWVCFGAIPEPSSPPSHDSFCVEICQGKPPRVFRPFREVGHPSYKEYLVRGLIVHLREFRVFGERPLRNRQVRVHALTGYGARPLVFL